MAKPAPPRPQPIRDAILAFLSEPRSAHAVAHHIDRPVPTATGHLAAMRRLGLVVRVGFSAYALAGYEGPALSFPKTSRRLPETVSALILSFLDQPRSVDAVARHIGRPVPETAAYLSTMGRLGLVQRPCRATYARNCEGGPAPQASAAGP